MVSSNCSCCFSKVGFSYYMVKNDEKSCVNCDVYFLVCPQYSVNQFSTLQEAKHCMVWDPRCLPNAL